jgi:SAM-dependent methyltransferase
MSPGFRRDELRSRYDISAISEDEWHEYSGYKTAEFITYYLSRTEVNSKLLLNAGAGVYEIQANSWSEISVDLFSTPLRNRQHAVCASIESLPFQAATFGAVVCVGEVLAYCDPAAAIAEFARVLVPSGTLICDFGNSRSFRYWLRYSYGRAADLVTDYYNGTPERIWVYDPAYVKSLLTSSGFVIKDALGTHTWSALARRLGASVELAIRLQRRLERLRLPPAWADLTTIVAERVLAAT